MTEKIKINNLKEMEPYRKALRNNMTTAEEVLWKYLKRKQLAGRKFRRQHSIGHYILDFYCPKEKLAIELDGAHHFTKEGMAYDAKRTAYLNEFQIKVIRFENQEVFQNIETVLQKIKSHLTS